MSSISEDFFLESSDPINRLLGRVPIRRIEITSLLTLILLNIPLVYLTATEGVLFSTSERIGLFHDIAWWLFQFISFPATLGLFLWLPLGINRTIHRLIENNVLLIENHPKKTAQLSIIFRRFNEVFNNSFFPVLLFIVLILFFAFLWIPSQRAFVSWQTANELIFWYTECIWFLVFFAGAWVIIRGIIFFRFLSVIFSRLRIQVRVLHPDSAGGLSPLGHFSTTIGYFIGIYGLAIAGGGLSQSIIQGVAFTKIFTDPGALSTWVVYFVLAPAIFFAPLRVAHQAMKDAKRRFLLQISDQFDKDFAKTKELLSSSSDKLQNNIEKVQQLRNLFDLARKFPIWPYNTTNLVRFCSSVIFPVAMTVFTIFLEQVIF